MKEFEAKAEQVSIISTIEIIPSVRLQNFPKN